MAAVNPRRRLEEQLVHVAPAPVLARFEAANDRVLLSVKVLGGVLARRVVATADVAAGEAEAEVHPCVAQFHAVFANVLIGCCELNFVCVLAFHLVTPFLARAASSRRLGPHTFSQLRTLSRISVYRYGCAVNHFGVLTAQEQDDARDLLRFRPLRKIGDGHCFPVCFRVNDAGEYRIHPHARAF